MTIARYSIGFVLSLILTLTAYNLVIYRSASTWLVAGLLVMAVVQMIVQLVFFLHMGDEAKPRYKLLSFSFMAGILIIIVVGSIWIMNNLDYNMMNMSPQEKTDYMTTQKDKGF